MENARLGVSTSKVSSSPSRRTRMYSVPSVRRSWVISSLRFKNEKPVWSDSRMTAVSRCNSARDRSSDQSLSPVVIGRFTTAATQSSVPAGLKEILPFVYARRATRLGGSSSSAAARSTAKSNTASAMLPRLIHFSSCFLMAFSPEHPRRSFALPQLRSQRDPFHLSPFVAFPSSLTLCLFKFRFATSVLSNQEIASASCSSYLNTPREKEF